jgi:hypothetical protein
MRVFRKLGAFVLLLCLAPILAACFGALHDQLSYAVAPEYFTRFKFVQFAWAGVASMPPRLGAAVVGALATWWVGIYAGAVLGTVALRRATASEMLREAGRAFGLVALVALSVGVVGLAVGWLGFDPTREYSDWWRPAGLAGPRRFFAAGMMHSGSYLGGAIGLVVAAARLWRRSAVRSAEPRLTISRLRANDR